MTGPERMGGRDPTRNVFPSDRLAGLFALVLLCGCGIVKRVAEVPQKTIEVVVAGKGGDKVNPADLQQRLMSLADDATLRIAAALDRFAAEVGTPAAEVEALRWKLANATTMLLVATGVRLRLPVGCRAIPRPGSTDAGEPVSCRRPLSPGGDGRVGRASEL